MKHIEAISLIDICVAQKHLVATIIRTLLVRLNVDDAPAEIYLQLESLKPIGLFKIRGMGNAIFSASRKDAAKGVWTASAGNVAQGVGGHARRLGLPFTTVVPVYAAETKPAAIRRLRGQDLL